MEYAGNATPITIETIVNKMFNIKLEPSMENPFSSASIVKPETSCICEVWKHNLEEEFAKIRDIVQTYKYIALDSEFPGVVARPIGEFYNTPEYNYHLVRCNVNLLRIIQLGFSFMDEKGNSPPGVSTWQFNFQFSLDHDMYAEDSISLLTNSGIQFKNHEKYGIDVFEFAELLMMSGVVLKEDVRFISFHSGFDFGYLMKILTGADLPDFENEFTELLNLYFPNIYDLKFMMKQCKNLKGGLQEISELLKITRIGPKHQAGSDALLTGKCFFKMCKDNVNNPLFTVTCTSVYLDYGADYINGPIHNHYK